MLTLMSTFLEFPFIFYNVQLLTRTVRETDKRRAKWNKISVFISNNFIYVRNLLFKTYWRRKIIIQLYIFFFFKKKRKL
jgi:hypothetical protein